MASDDEKLSLKLVVNKETNKVLFAEAGKDFVDILFHLLTFPLGTITRLVGKSSNIMDPITVGCLKSLYQSVENLDKECMLASTCKEMLLRPRNPWEIHCRSLKFTIDDTEPVKYFTCCENLNGCYNNMLSTSKDVKCKCGSLLTRPVPVRSDIICKGFVKDGETYIVTDDLIVKPNSSRASFVLLQNSGMKDFSSVKEVTVNVFKRKVLDLLKASFLTKSALTHIFLLDKTPSPERSSFSPSNVDDMYSIEIDIKLFIRKSDRKIMYAEGKEKFPDFLFSFLTLPLGGVVRLFGGDCSPGSVGGLYKSLVDLLENISLMLYGVKNMLAPYINIRNKLPNVGHDAPDYICSRPNEFRDLVGVDKLFLSCGYRADYDRRRLYTKLMNLVDPKSCGGSHEGGHMKRASVFMATDDLIVTPMSQISAISLLNRLKTPPSDLMEKNVTIGFKEGVGIMKAALISTSALTNGLSHLLTKVKEEK